MKLCDEQDCHDADDHAVPWHAKIHEDRDNGDHGNENDQQTSDKAETITIDGKCHTQI